MSASHYILDSSNALTSSTYMGSAMVSSLDSTPLGRTTLGEVAAKVIVIGGSVVSAPSQYSGTTGFSSTATATATVFTIAAGEYGFIQNLDDVALYVKNGTSCTTSSFSFVLAAGNAALDGLGSSATITDIGAVSVCPATGTASYIAWKRAT